MIDKEIRIVLMSIDELGDKVHMLKSPKGAESPYAVYTMNRNEAEYHLKGITNNDYCIFDINIYAKDQMELKQIAYKVKKKLLSLRGTTLGAFLIQNIIVDISDFYDSNVDMNRSAISLEINFKEEN